MLTELQNYLQRIENLRGQISDLIAAMPIEALNWRPIEGGNDHVINSLAVLAVHVAGAEHSWMAEVIAGRPKTRRREAEFAAQVDDPAELMALLDNVADETRAIFAKLQPADLDDTREVKGKTIPVRWVILHVIDHLALHLGHMQITYQLWQGGQGFHTPRWYDRLPK